MTSLHHIEAIIIGAGVVGLSCARTLSRMGKEVLVLERQTTIGSGTSSRNSEVIHAGLYYPPNSYKAEMCVRGRNLLYEYCQSRNIEYQKMGKLIVANSLEQYQTNLMEIKKRGEINGVPNLRLLTQVDVEIMEPEVRCCYGALYSPETGVVDPHGFMLSLLGEAEDHGATLALNSPVKDVKYDRQKENFVVHSQDLDLSCDVLVNCAGLFAGHIASLLFHDYTNSSTPTYPSHLSPSSQSSDTNAHVPIHQYFAKGNYYRLQNQKNPFHHLIYPIPEPGGLGVHATIDLGGNCRFGPDVEWIPIETKNPDDIDLEVDSNHRIHKFYDQIREYWPNLQNGNLVPDYAGIRPKLSHPTSISDMVVDSSAVGNNDFVIQSEKEHGIKGYIHLMGLESPGLTSSLAMAEKIGLLLASQHK